MKIPFRHRAVQAYWWNEVPNFGDALAPLLLERFAYLRVEWSPVSRARIASVGSILDHIPPLWDGIILGSGKLREDTRVHLLGARSRAAATILALRGPLSAKGIPGSYALGDPGILADELVGPQEKLWDLGILPHFSDTELVPRFRALTPAQQSIRVIHPGTDPLTVLREIGSCRQIVTSSLHGMIVADAFGIPRRVEACPKPHVSGGEYKFRDYSASIRTPLEPGKMTEPNRGYVEDVKFAIYDAYRALGSLVKS